MHGRMREEIAGPCHDGVCPAGAVASATHLLPANAALVEDQRAQSAEIGVGRRGRERHAIGAQVQALQPRQLMRQIKHLLPAVQEVGCQVQLLQIWRQGTQRAAWPLQEPDTAPCCLRAVKAAPPCGLACSCRQAWCPECPKMVCYRNMLSGSQSLYWAVGSIMVFQGGTQPHAGAHHRGHSCAGQGGLRGVP